MGKTTSSRDRSKLAAHACRAAARSDSSATLGTYMSTIHCVIGAEYRGGHQIHVTFDDKLEKTIDFRGWLKGPIFEPLKDLKYFQRFFSGRVDNCLAQRCRHRPGNIVRMRRRYPSGRTRHAIAANWPCQTQPSCHRRLKHNEPAAAHQIGPRGHDAAEVDVDLNESDDGWSPYLSLDDAHELDQVREAL